MTSFFGGLLYDSVSSCVSGSIRRVRTNGGSVTGR